MKYTVLWSKEAEANLAAIWLASENREEVARAVDELDRFLHSVGHSLGESRGGERRIAFQGPIGITFKVSNEDRFVLVSSVWAPKR